MEEIKKVASWGSGFDPFVTFRLERSSRGDQNHLRVSRLVPKKEAKVGNQAASDVSAPQSYENKSEDESF